MFRAPATDAMAVCPYSEQNEVECLLDNNRAVRKRLGFDDMEVDEQHYDSEDDEDGAMERSHHEQTVYTASSLATPEPLFDTPNDYSPANTAPASDLSSPLTAYYKDRYDHYDHNEHSQLARHFAQLKLGGWDVNAGQALASSQSSSWSYQSPPSSTNSPASNYLHDTIAKQKSYAAWIRQL